MIEKKTVIGILMDLYSVDVSTLTEREQMQLAVFHQAYRPHTAIPSRAVLKAEGNGGYFAEHNTLDEIKEQASCMDAMYYGFLQTVTRDEFGNICDDPE